MLNFPVDYGILDRIRSYYRLVVPRHPQTKAFVQRIQKGIMQMIGATKKGHKIRCT